MRWLVSYLRFPECGGVLCLWAGRVGVECGLQRSRARVRAEGHRPRRPPDAHPHASTEPRAGARGRKPLAHLGFGHGTTASTEPRAGARGRQLGAHPRGDRFDMLQRSRARVRAEGQAEAWRRVAMQPASTEPRAGARGRRDHDSGGAFADRASTEPRAGARGRLPPRRTHHSTERASTEPRAGARGRPLMSRSCKRCITSFNGAARGCARKAADDHEGCPGEPVASTEPRAGARGRERSGPSVPGRCHASTEPRAGARGRGPLGSADANGPLDTLFERCPANPGTRLHLDFMDHQQPKLSQSLREVDGECSPPRRSPTQLGAFYTTKCRPGGA